MRAESQNGPSMLPVLRQSTRICAKTPTQGLSGSVFVELSVDAQVGPKNALTQCMYNLKKILFPVDFSARSRATAPFVLSMAQRYQAHVVLIHAFEPPPPIYGGMNMVYPEIYDFAGIAAEVKQQLVTFAAAELPKVEVECVVQQGFAAPVITDYAAENQVDLIVMPTHGYGTFRRALLGSVTAKALHDSNVPVWTDAHAPEPAHRAHPQPRVIVVALDLKSDSKQALEAASNWRRIPVRAWKWFMRRRRVKLHH